MGESVFRVASNFDAFRLEKGEVARPDKLDDSNLQEYIAAKLEAYLYVKLLLAQSKERWGAAAWPRGQFRCAADNKFDPSATPTRAENLCYEAKNPK